MTTAIDPKTTVDRRFDFVLLFDVTDGNPNGDPDAGNLPRVDPQTMQGLVTDVCLKRKVRNAIAVIADGRPGCDLYFQTQDAVYEKRVLNLVHQSAWDALGLKASVKGSVEEGAAEKEPVEGGKKSRKEKGGSDRGDFDKVRATRAWMCQQFYDVRAFGAVMTTGVNCGQVRGPVQLTFARSVDSIVPLEVSITRKSVTTEKEANDQINKADSETNKRFGTITGTMGRKNMVPYALYRAHGFVNPYLAKDTGFSFSDLELLWQALRGQMWELDRSASRGLMATRGLFVFEHESALGNAPAHELFDRISVRPYGDDANAKPPRSFDDYRSRLTVSENELPKGISLHRMVG